MPNLYVKLPLQNESTKPINIVLEPLSESFCIQPGESVEIHGICDDKTSNVTFTVAPNDSFLRFMLQGRLGVS
jgi:hypothetical protein